MFSAISLIQSGIGRAKRIAVWTNKTQVRFRIISPIAVYVVCDKRHLAGFWIYFGPSA